MPLRSDNQTPTVASILTGIAAAALPNTQFQASSGTVCINDDSLLVTQQGPWPALLLLDNGQTDDRIAWKLWRPKLTALLVYMDRWDQQTINLDVLWQNINTDIRRMKANITDTQTLVSLLNAIERITLSPFANQSIERERYGAVPVVQRAMTLTITLLPYVSGG